MEDFGKPKIIYPETTQGAYFAYDEHGRIMLDKTCFMMISDDAKYLQRVLSSKLFEYAYKRIFSSIELGPSGYQYNKHAFIKLPVLKPNKQFRDMINECSLDSIDEIINRTYKITDEEYNALI